MCRTTHRRHPDERDRAPAQRDVPLTARLLAAVAFALAFLPAPGPGACAADDAWLVLVASANSPLAPLTPAQVRHLYLGVPLSQNGHELIALRNAASAEVAEMFLQRVLFLSARACERQMATRIYRSGGSRIPEYASLHSLVEALAADPWAVTCMHAGTAARTAGIKILGVL